MRWDWQIEVPGAACTNLELRFRMRPNRRKMSMPVQATFLIVFVGLWASVACGEIYLWQDPAGVRHFTNVREEIPAEYRERVQVVVSSVWLPKEEFRVEDKACEQEPSRQAQVVVVPERKRAAARVATLPTRPIIVQGGNVTIEGPLATAFAPSTVNWTGWLATPLVTTAFDRGRSRHLTLRQLAEEQIWLQETVGWPVSLWQLVPFAGGPRPPCVAWRTCSLR